MNADAEWPAPELGPCCVCRRTGPLVRNVIMLDRKSPIPGRGWGCAACGLAADGATAVVCDECIGPIDPRTGLPLGDDIETRLLDACRGHAGQDGRVPFAELEGEHRHDPAGHPELAGDEDAANDWPEGYDDEELDRAWGFDPCSIAGCRRHGVVLLFAGEKEDDPSMTMARFCTEHFSALYSTTGGVIRPPPGVDAAALVPRPPSLDPN